MPVTVVIRKRALEDHYDSPCAVALTPDGAAAWVERVVARSKRRRLAYDVARAAETAWFASHPDPFAESEPPRPPKWPHGLSVKDPQHEVLRVEREQMNAAIQAWQRRRTTNDQIRRGLIAEAVRVAQAPYNFTMDELRYAHYDVESADDYEFETWETAEEEESAFKSP